MFLQSIISHFLGNLLILAYQKNMDAILADEQTRKEVDAIIKEIFHLLKIGEKQIDDYKILPDIYAFPDNYISEYASQKGVRILWNMIKNIDYFASPVLFELLSKISNKY